MLTGSLFGQDFSKIQVEKAAAGYRFTEGPVYSRDGFLLFSDVPNNKILKLTPGEGISLFRENSNGANGNTFDAQGRLVRTLANRTYPAGFHDVEWDRRSEGGHQLGAGVYLYRIQAGTFRDQKKLVLLAR